jgi:hypothetical protein
MHAVPPAMSGFGETALFPPAGLSAVARDLMLDLLRDSSHQNRRIDMRTEDRLDRLLDEALEMTFPASDPFTVYMPEVDVAEDRAFDQETITPFPIAA